MLAPTDWFRVYPAHRLKQRMLDTPDHLLFVQSIMGETKQLLNNIRDQTVDLTEAGLDHQ